MEGAIGADGDAGGDWSTEDEVGGAGVEFLGGILVYLLKYIDNGTSPLKFALPCRNP